MKNHKWQLVAGTLTTATVVTLAALGIKYLIPKNKEEPKKEPKKEELKEEEHEPKKKPKKNSKK